VKIGMAVRIAQDLRFMMDTATDLSYADQEERRRVFWSVYLLDRLVSCGRGRPPAILDASCQLQLPCDEQTWRDGNWKPTLTLEQLSNRTLLGAEQQGPFAHVVVMAYTLSRGAQYMLQEFNIRNRDPPWDANSDFAAIESDLLYLESHLEMRRPPMDIIAQYCSKDGKIDQHSAGPIVFSHALFHLCYCLLNHPFLLRRRLDTCRMAAPSSFLSRAFISGWEHAKRLTELLKDTRKAGCIAQTSFYGYCAAIAGTIASLHLHSDNNGMRQESSLLLKENIHYLEDISKYWKNVSSMVSLLLYNLPPFLNADKDNSVSR
jgi:Fungal specific transcription factor domain